MSDEGGRVKTRLVTSRAVNDADAGPVVGAIGERATNARALPMFPSLGQAGIAPEYIAVHCVDPPEKAGYMGRLTDLSADDETLRQRWGPGTYRLEVKGGPQHQILKGGTAMKTIRGAADAPAAAAAPAVDPFANAKRAIELERTLADERMKMLREEVASAIERRKAEAAIELEKAKAESALRVQEAEQKAARELALVEARAKVEREANEARLKAERDEREARYRSDLEREKARNDEARQRDQQMFATLTAITSQSNQTMIQVLASSQTKTDPLAFVQVLERGLSMGQSMSGNDPATQQLEVMGKAVTALGNAALGQPAAPADGAAPVRQVGGAPAARALPNPAPAAKGGGSDKMQRIEEKAKRLLLGLAQKGVDPEEELDAALADLEGMPHASETSDEDEGEGDDGRTEEKPRARRADAARSGKDPVAGGARSDGDRAGAPRAGGRRRKPAAGGHAEAGSSGAGDPKVGGE